MGGRAPIPEPSSAAFQACIDRVGTAKQDAGVPGSVSTMCQRPVPRNFSKDGRDVCGCYRCGKSKAILKGGKTLPVTKSSKAQRL